MTAIQQQKATLTEQLMNGHEYISMHGYDMYDFGFRHYYATIGRFTSPDPLSERTPWQSPYVYASNNFTGEIDWMGLMTFDEFTNRMNDNNQCNFIVIDNESNIIGIVENDDYNIYLDEDGTWTREKGTEGLIKVGLMVGSHEMYAQQLLYDIQYNIPTRAWGFYYNQLILSLSVSIGCDFEKAMPIPPIIPKNLHSEKKRVGLNLCSVELLDFSVSLPDIIVEINHIGKDNKTKVSQSLSLGPLFSINHEFLIKSSTADYIPATDKVTVNFIAQLFNSAENNNGRFEISWGESFIIGYSFTISGNIYYEP